MREAGHEAIKPRGAADIELLDASKPPMLMRCPDRPAGQRGREAALAGAKAQELGIRRRQGAPSLKPSATDANRMLEGYIGQAFPGKSFKEVQAHAEHRSRWRWP